MKLASLHMEWITIHYITKLAQRNLKRIQNENILVNSRYTLFYKIKRNRSRRAREKNL